MNTSNGSGTNKARRRDSDPGEEEMDITSMIDLTFLLLIFFMVSSSISPAQSLELPESTSGKTEEVEQQVVLVLDFFGEDTNRNGTLDPGEDTNGNESLDGGFAADHAAPLSGAQPVTLDAVRLFLLKQPEENIAPGQLESTLRARLAEDENAAFILQASRKMPASIVREVLKIANRAGARQSTVAVWVPQ